MSGRTKVRPKRSPPGAVQIGIRHRSQTAAMRCSESKCWFSWWVKA